MRLPLRRASGLLGALLVAAAALAAAPAAWANGRYPAAGQIAVDPSDPTHVVVRATYGTLLSRDRGGSWAWVCEQAIGYSGFEDPMLGVTKDGSLLAGIFEGLSVSHDQGCTWAFVGGGLAGRFVVDLSTERADPSHAVAIFSNSLSASSFITQVWQSTDDGRTWKQEGSTLPSELLALTIDVAPSDPNRIYVSGRVGPPKYPGVLERSKDRGVTWQQLAIPGASDTALPYLAAIDPKDPDILYVRLSTGGLGDTALVSKDGGQTWKKFFTTMGNLYGFALSPDGSTIALGGDLDGLWRAPVSTLAFTKLSKLGTLCLTWVDSGLYSCADEFKDGFTAGRSLDQGKSFVPLMHLANLCGPLTCGATTSVGEICPGTDPNQTDAGCCAAAWPMVASLINAEPCDGGAGGGPDASTTATTSTGSAGSPGSSSGCSAPPTTAVWTWPALTAAAAALALRRRRR